LIILSKMTDMPSKSPLVFPAEQQLLTALGERIRLARKRRKLAATAVAQRSGISRSSLHKVESGDAAVTLGVYVRVLATMGLEGDINGLAADDVVGRKLQDLALDAASRRTPARTTAAADHIAPQP
jgi:transcriptional regulator with XRE-family HTH domain